jgi:2,3-diketo-5-methylthio-1-phosphopentane phosphatase
MPIDVTTPTPLSAAWAVFVDFDGTITDRDTFDVLVPIFAAPGHWDATERGLDDGSLSIREVLSAQAALVRGDHAEIAALLRREVRLDPAFAAFARACTAADIPLTIVSSGIESIIRDRLDEAGIPDVPIVANAVDPNPAGWKMTFRDDVDNGTDKAAVIARAARHGLRTVFVGDGRSDFDAARAADVCFAKRGLALERYLVQHAIPFAPFTSFADVLARAVELRIL